MQTSHSFILLSAINHTTSTYAYFLETIYLLYSYLYSYSFVFHSARRLNYFVMVYPTRQRAWVTQNGFQKGGIPHNKGVRYEAVTPPHVENRYLRLTHEQYEMAASGRIYEREAPTTNEHAVTHTMLLRPRGERARTLVTDTQDAINQDAEMDTYRIWHPKLTANLWNSAIDGHRLFKKTCRGSLLWDAAGEQKWGLAWRERLKCDTCDYTSPTHKLYKEVESPSRGPNAATLNVGSQVGMTHTSIAATGLSKILYSANIPAPTRSAFQKSANKARDKIINSNEKSMKAIRKDIRVAKNAVNPHTQCDIDIELDARYNNQVYSGVGNTPFQAATQVTQLVVENCSSQRKVIAETTHDKLCPGCAVNERRMTIGLPAKEHGCSATLRMDESIGNDRRWSRETLTRLQTEGITARNIITDPDSAAYLASVDLYHQGDATNVPTHQLDTRHVTSNQRKFIKKKTFSAGMFPGRTVAAQKKMQGNFANDLATRCHAEHAAAMSASGGDTGKANKRVMIAKEAIIPCYQGNHEGCRRKSQVCKAKKTSNWVTKSPYLPDDFKIKPKQKDIEQLNESIDYRLGHDIMQKVKYLQNTQKVESVNRAIGITNPKNMTFTRNARGRVSSAVHAVNDGVAESIASTCRESGAELTQGTRVTRGLLALSRQNHLRKTYKKSKTAINSRREKRKRLYTLHRNRIETDETTYKSGMLMNSKKNRQDHNYSK